MEKNKIIWDNLSPEEKANYLGFWFHYFGGAIYTLEDGERFIELSKTKADDIYAHICTLSILKDTIQSTTFLGAMRQNKVDDLFAHNITKGSIETLNISDADKAEMIAFVEETRGLIINAIDNARSNPEPDNTTVIVVPGSRN